MFVIVAVWLAAAALCAMFWFMTLMAAATDMPTVRRRMVTRLARFGALLSVVLAVYETVRALG